MSRKFLGQANFVTANDEKDQYQTDILQKRTENKTS